MPSGTCLFLALTEPSIHLIFYVSLEIEVSISLNKRALIFLNEISKRTPQIRYIYRLPIVRMPFLSSETKNCQTKFFFFLKFTESVLWGSSKLEEGLGYRHTYAIKSLLVWGQCIPKVTAVTMIVIAIKWCTSANPQPSMNSLSDRQTDTVNHL